jgi:site-specific DNA recombinase
MDQNEVYKALAFELAHKIARQRKAMAKGKEAKKASGGYAGGQVPYGFRANHEKRELEIDPVEQRGIVQMVDLYQQGHSLRAIGRQLDAEGVPTKDGRPWQGQSIKRILVRVGVYEEP